MMGSFCKVLLLALFLVDTSQAARPKFVLTKFHLPTPATKHSAVYDGQNTIYVLGGHNEERVSKFNIVDGTVEVIGSFEKVYNGAAAMDGEDILYFGGYISGSGRRSLGVYRYSTVHRNYTMINHLPIGSERLAMAWDAAARKGYMFGGTGDRGHQDSVLRYTAESNTLEQVALLPERRSGASAVWDARHQMAFLFGGEGTSRSLSRDIFRFKADTSSLVRVPTTLPHNVEWPCAAMGKDFVYILGDKGRMVKFDPASERVESIAVEGWSRPLTYSACVYVAKQGRIYVIGGYGSFRQGEVKERRTEISYIDLGTPDSVGVPADAVHGVQGTRIQSYPNYLNKIYGL